MPAVAMTAAASGLIGLLDRPSSGLAGEASGDSAPLPDPGAPATPTQPPVVSSTVPAVVPAEDGGGTVPAEQPVATTNAPVPAPPTTPVASAGECTGSTLDGPSVDTRWGPVQVEAVISSTGEICNVDAIRSPDSHGRSVRINQQALPILHAEVIKAQSANINGVSGATITSDAYVRSLQAILDGATG
jgi:uncharacterized protein with FMN-binding domain